MEQAVFLFLESNLYTFQQFPFWTMCYFLTYFGLFIVWGEWMDDYGDDVFEMLLPWQSFGACFSSSVLSDCASV